MSCNACVRHVERALDRLIGVINVDVDLAKEIAVVEHHSAYVPDTVLAAAVRDAGYMRASKRLSPTTE